MATPSELSLEEMLNFLLDSGGLVRNQDLVRHFKKFLVQPDTRVIARNKFKEYINTLATIKTIEGEKYLELKRKFRDDKLDLSSPTLSFPHFPTSPPVSPVYSSPILHNSPLREPPPYRLPPTPLNHYSNGSSNVSSPSFRYVPEPYKFGLPLPESAPKDNEPGNFYKNVIQEEVENSAMLPPIPPRRRSQDKIKAPTERPPPPPPPSVIAEKPVPLVEVNKEDKKNSSTNQLTPAEQLSVRERMQRFNRMANETDRTELPSRANQISTLLNKKRLDKGNEDDDRASVASQLDGKSREWLVKAAQGDYHALAKLAAEEPRLARTKTALHWGAKHGDENIIKLIAGTCKNYIKSVNETSNGGYTPLHIAVQFANENIYSLLVQVYGANQDVRDYSGKKPRQYSISQRASISQDTIRKIKSRKKHTEKDLGFLRIGSLNVRVKRTTEAFSQFLGVASNSTSNNNNEKIHKTWGSADHIPYDQKLMPPPKYASVKKRRSRRAQDFLSPQKGQFGNSLVRSKTVDHRSTSSASPKRPMSTTLLMRRNKENNREQNDSDSDTACGFDATWRESTT